MINRPGGWAEIAADAAVTAADYRDEGDTAAAAEWADIARLRASVAMAAALVEISESLARIAEHMDAAASVAATGNPMD